MVLFEFMDVIAIACLWFAVPLITLRLVATFRAALPGWERKVSVAVQWTLLALLIIAVPILVLRLIASGAEKAAARRGMRGEGAGEGELSRTVHSLRRGDPLPLSPLSESD